MRSRVTLGLVAALAAHAAGAEPARPSLSASLARITTDVRAHGSYRTTVTTRGRDRFVVRVRQRFRGRATDCTATSTIREADKHGTRSATLHVPLREVRSVRVVDGSCAAGTPDDERSETRCSLVMVDADRRVFRVEGDAPGTGRTAIVARVRQRSVAERIARALQHAVARCR